MHIHLIRSIAMVLLLLPHSLYANNGEWQVLEPAPLPDIHWHGATGERGYATDYNGDVLLINLWATWCTPCIEEMPALSELQDSYSSKGLSVLAVSQDAGKPDEVKAFYEKLGIHNLDVLTDDHRDTFKKLETRGLPTTVVVNRSGKMVARVEGLLDWTSSDVKEELEKLLAQ